MSASSKYSKTRQILLALSLSFRSIVEIILAIFLLSIVLLSPSASANHSIGMLAVTMYVALRLIPVVGNVSNIPIQLSYAEPVLKEVTAVLKSDETIEMPSNENVKVCYTDDRESILLKITSPLIENDIKFNRFKAKFKRGDIIHIKGISGIGKTTFINSVIVDQIIQKKKNSNINHVDNLIEDIVLVPQSPALFDYSLKENVFFDKEINHKIIEKIFNLLSLENFYFKLEDHIQQMSDGERQRVAISRALLSEADVWFLDEPTASLNQEMKERVAKLIKANNANRFTFVISHDAVWENVANRSIELSKKEDFVNICTVP